jgi:hypothetical protein
MADLIQTRTGFESNMMQVGSQVVPKVSSSGLSTIKGPVDLGHLAFILHTKLTATDDVIHTRGRRLQVSIPDGRGTQFQFI